MKTPKTKFEFWLRDVNIELKDEFEKQFSNLNYKPLTYTKGKKYIRILRQSTVWGFVSMVDGDIKGSPVMKGDLLKPANYNSPAKWARGNIFNGTASYSMYGPNYIK